LVKKIKTPFLTQKENVVVEHWFKTPAMSTLTVCEKGKVTFRSLTTMVSCSYVFTAVKNHRQFLSFSSIYCSFDIILFVPRNKTIWTLRLDKTRIYYAQFQFRVVGPLIFWYRVWRFCFSRHGTFVTRGLFFWFIENHAVSC